MNYMKEIDHLALDGHALELSADGHSITYTYDTQAEHTGIVGLLDALTGAGIGFKDLSTTQSSLEDIFVSLVHEARAP